MKEYPHLMGLDQVWKYFEGFPLAHLATIDGEQPRVRPMSLISHNGMLWLATKSSWAKVGQIQLNNNIEFVVVVKSEKGVGTLRVTGTAEITADNETKKEISSAIPWFKSYWSSPNDPEFSLIRLNPILIRYDHPDDGKKYRVEVESGDRE